MDQMKRREFLIDLAGKTAGAFFPGWMPRLAFAPPGVQPGGDLLMCLFLRGGVDSLNLVVPQFEDAYYQQRSTLAVPPTSSGKEGAAIDLDGRFGLHPALHSLKGLWDDGHLAIVHAVGSPDPTHSHFEAMDYMERGTPGERTLPTGWIGRHLQTAPWQNPSVLRAVGMGGISPAALHGPVPVITLQSIGDFHLQGDSTRLVPLQKVIQSLYALTPDLQTPAQETLEAVSLIQKINLRSYQPGNGAQYPKTDYGQALMQVAQLARANAGLEVACVDLGGFDTHVDEASRLSRLFEEFSNGLAALYQDLQDLQPRLTVITMSEFGRRLAENGNGGTDHGHGGVMFAVGSRVNGKKVYANWPGLDSQRLYGPGDLDVTTDYRNVLSELVAQRLGNPSQLGTIFPGYRPTSLGIFAPGT